MLRTILTVFLASFTLITFAQQQKLPVSIKTPNESKLTVHVYAKGVQVYVCVPDTTDTSRFVWLLKGPQANLYTDSTFHQLVGKHYYNTAHQPTWESTDGSTVSGAKLQQANSPDGNSIPWLLLKAIGHTGNGTFSSANFIQRINTKGGKAPATADKTKKGQTLAVAYTAEYVFYGDK